MKKQRNIKRISILLATLLALTVFNIIGTSCTTKVTSITVSSYYSVVSVGKQIKLTANVSPSDASDKSVTWTSSNTSKATVSSSGLVTGKAAGTVTITATAQDGSGVSGSRQITVRSIVTLNKNGGTGSINEVYATYGQYMPYVPMPTRTNYMFRGYYDTNASSGGTQYYTIPCSSARTWNKTTNATLYARWVSATKACRSQYAKMGLGYMFDNTSKNRITSPFGPRSSGYHTGADWANNGVVSGTDIKAVAKGKVVYVNKNASNWRGYCVAYELNNYIDPVSGNKLRVTVMHLLNAPTLKVEDSINAGQVMGKVGNTGDSFGAHLHMEINNSGSTWPSPRDATNGHFINPLYFYPTITFELSSSSTNPYLYWDIADIYKN